MTSKARARFVIAAIYVALVMHYGEHLRLEPIDDPVVQVAIHLATLPYLPDEPAGSKPLPIAYRTAVAYVSAASATNVIFRPIGTPL
jgi:hypothetical protein